MDAFFSRVASWSRHAATTTSIALLTAVAAEAADPPATIAPVPRSPPAVRPPAGDDRLAALDLADLMRVRVTSAAGKPQERSSTAAATYVLTHEDLLRSGVRSLPEALALAPGVQVARVTANQWAIGVRGFASRLARSTLVLMDGRSVYTPLFAGTYWEVQDALLEDVAQIEVIRGPGGAVWGANAFNGVINVLTKNARETQGWFLEVGGGNEEEGFGALRYGGELAPDVFYRIYGKAFSRDGGHDAQGTGFDDWQIGQAGFRLDWDRGTSDVIRLQGDYYEGSVGQRLSITEFDPPSSRGGVDDARLAGGNLLGSWQRFFDDGSDLTVQTYVDGTYRDEANLRQQQITWDVEAQHRITVFDRHDVLWGGGYRVYADDTRGVESVEFLPHDRTLHLASGFVQDEILVLPDRLHAILGARLEHDDYSGWQVSPSARVLWLPDEVEAVWASVSRAVRTPSRVEQDLRLDSFSPPLGGLVRILGQGDFDPEKIVAYEAGVRARPVARVFVDAAIFYNDFDDLLSLEPGTPFEEVRAGAPRRFLPLVIANGLDGESYGFELAADADVASGWRVRATYAWLDIELDRQPSSADPSSESAEDGSPQNQLAVRSMLDLPRRFQLDGVLRWVDRLSGPDVPSYFDVTVRLAHRWDDHLEIALVGQDLVEARHLEFANGTQVERSVYGSLRWRW